MTPIAQTLQMVTYQFGVDGYEDLGVLIDHNEETNGGREAMSS